MLIAVLNGSTSTTCSLSSGLSAAAASTSASTTYLKLFNQRSVTPRSRRCAMPSLRATIATSSCNAPNGHSQPQKVPRPQIKSVAKVKSHSTTAIGSANRKSSARPATKASTIDVRLTIVS